MSYCRPFERKLYDLRVVWRSQNFGDNATIYGPHSGNDDAAPVGTAVHAAGDGYIDWAGEFDDTYADNLLWLLKMGGNILVLNCGADKPSFVYGHMHSFTVKRGDWVRKSLATPAIRERQQQARTCTLRPSPQAMRSTAQCWGASTPTSI
jgi:murein DD-endopeptidase MepM/ murein hydrolase activator NlpD